MLLEVEASRVSMKISPKEPCFIWKYGYEGSAILMDLLSDLAQSVSQNSIFVVQEGMWGNFGLV